MNLQRPYGQRWCRLLLWCMLFALAVTFGCPSRQARAASFAVDAVDIDATVGVDGSLTVVERRTYDFTGTFGGIYWDVPRGSFEGAEVTATVESVGVREGETTTPFAPAQEPDVGAPATYELEEEPDCLHLKLYWPGESERVTFELRYRLSNLALRWVDTAELYWQYVPADEGSGPEWQNVTARLHLPMPQGEHVVPGENVRAWGHGPLDGEVSFDGATVVFASPGVGSAECLEAHLAFPGAWLSEVQTRDEARLDAILAEEDRWAKDANAQRRMARLRAFGLPALMCALGIGSIAADKLHRKIKKQRGATAEFADTYYRDVPTNDHPAVLGMLHREGQLDGRDFSATLMRLVDEGRASMDLVMVGKQGKRGGASGKKKREWRMVLRRDAPVPVRRPKVRAGGKKIDNAAFDFLYDVVADKRKHSIDPLLLGPAGEPYVVASFFKETAKGWPSAYRDGYNTWRDAVEEAFRSRGFVEGAKDDLLPGLLMLGDFALAVVLGIVCIFAGVPNLLAGVSIIVLFACGIYLALTSDDSETTVFYSQEALEVRAKLEALKRWLTDFTRLEEAIPTDVVLWNRLLVVATALGVAEEVLRQLKVYVPEVVRNSGFVASGWYEDDLDEDFFVPAVTPPLAEESQDGSYHSTSSYDVASSRDSSSRGSGGGFSGGGGGGFSGGGRGGAF